MATKGRACQNWSLRPGAERFLSDPDLFLNAIRRRMQANPEDHLVWCSIEISNEPCPLRGMVGEVVP